MRAMQRREERRGCMALMAELYGVHTCGLICMRYTLLLSPCVLSLSVPLDCSEPPTPIPPDTTFCFHFILTLYFLGFSKEIKIFGRVIPGSGISVQGFDKGGGPTDRFVPLYLCPFKDPIIIRSNTSADVGNSTELPKQNKKIDRWISSVLCELFISQ